MKKTKHFSKQESDLFIKLGEQISSKPQTADAMFLKLLKK